MRTGGSSGSYPLPTWAFEEEEEGRRSSFLPSFWAFDDGQLGRGAEGCGRMASAHT